jgi:tight adherence protein C
MGRTGKGALAEEFRLVDKEINVLGITASQALDRMAKRCNSKYITSFCISVAQAQELGTSVQRVLQSQAKLARDAMYSQKMEKINKIPNHMFPIIILTFIPAVVIIALAPSIGTIFTSLADMTGSLSGTF